MTGDALAKALGWQPAKVSRTEHGRRTATAADVLAWVAATGGPPHLADDLLAELRQVRIEHRRLARLARHGVTRHQIMFQNQEANATVLRVFDPLMIPGLLQTPDYARDILIAATRSWPVADIGRAVATRMLRQQILDEPERSTRMVICEAALHTRTCSPHVMGAQLAHLERHLHFRPEQLAVIPFTTRLPVTVLHGFWIFDDQLVLAETVTSEIAVRDPDDIATYVSRFTDLWEIGMKGADAMNVIRTARSSLMAGNPSMVSRT